MHGNTSVIHISHGLRFCFLDDSNISAKELFKKVLNPLEEMSTSLNITWGIAKTLYLGNHSLMPTQYYISINQRAKKASATAYVSRPIYEACKNVLNDKENKLSDQQRSLLNKFVLEGKLNGLELTGKKSLQYKELTILLLNKIDEYTQKLEVYVYITYKCI